MRVGQWVAGWAALKVGLLDRLWAGSRVAAKAWSSAGGWAALWADGWVAGSDEKTVVH